MPDGIRIRDYDDALDRNALIAFYRLAWHDAYDAIDGAAAIECVIAHQLSGTPPPMVALDPGDLALVAERRGDIVAAARAHPRGDCVHLSGVYVASDGQRQGLGSALLRALARRLSAPALWRADVRAQSPGAVNFYLGHGFREVGRSQQHFATLDVAVVEMAREPA